MRRRKWLIVLAALAALLVTGVVWWLWPERVKPFDESEVWTVEVEAPEPPEVIIPTVTVDVTDAPVSEVLAEMNTQAQVTLGADDATKAKVVTLQVKDVPVLQAFAKVADLTGSWVKWRKGVGLELAAEERSGSPDVSLMGVPHGLASVGPCLLFSARFTFVHGDSGTQYESCAVVTHPPPWPLAEDSGGPALSTGETASTAGGVTLSTVVSPAPPTFVAPALQARPPLEETVKLTFGVPVELEFNLKADRGKRYRVGSGSYTYQGYRIVSNSVAWPWPLNRLRFLGRRQRGRVTAAWRIEGGYWHWRSFCFRDRAGQGLGRGEMVGFPVPGSPVWGAFVIPPKGSATLVLRVVPRTTELTYTFDFIEARLRKHEGEQRPSAP